MTYLWWTLGIWTVIAFALVIYDGFVVKRPPAAISITIVKQVLMLPFLLIMWFLTALPILFLLVVCRGDPGEHK